MGLTIAHKTGWTILHAMKHIFSWYQQCQAVIPPCSIAFSKQLGRHSDLNKENVTMKIHLASGKSFTLHMLKIGIKIYPTSLWNDVWWLLHHNLSQTMKKSSWYKDWTLQKLCKPLTCIKWCENTMTMLMMKKVQIRRAALLMLWPDVMLKGQQNYENAVLLYEMYSFGLQTLYMP